MVNDKEKLSKFVTNKLYRTLLYVLDKLLSMAKRNEEKEK